MRRFCSDNRSQLFSRPCPRSTHEVSSVAQFALQKTQEAHVSSGCTNGFQGRPFDLIKEIKRCGTPDQSRVCRKAPYLCFKAKGRPVACRAAPSLLFYFGDKSRLRPASLYDVSYSSDQCGSLRHIGDERLMIAEGLGSLLGILQKPIFKTRGNFEIIISHGLPPS